MIDWDSSLPADFHTVWSKYYEQLIDISEITIPRHVLCLNPIQIELHGYSDASRHAFGACVYVRFQDEKKRWHSNLLCAKAKVAPLNTLDITKLELNGALLLSRLVDKVIKSSTLHFSDVHYWIDSTIALAWIYGEPYKWKTFVANRVSEIQRLSNKDNWHYIKGQENPADIISRGLTPQELKNSGLWWNGHPSLCTSNLEFPEFDYPSDKLTEYRVQTNIFFLCITEFDILKRYSSLVKLKRVIAYMLRFKYNCKISAKQKKARIMQLQTPLKRNGSLLLEELNSAMKIIVNISQAQDFSTEINDLCNKREISKQSKILNLNAFIDDSKILRVGGRLQNADLSYEAKFPIILSKDSYLATLLV